MKAERNFLIHPYFILISLVFIGIGFLFLAFSASYVYNRIQSGVPPIALPWLFYVNTLILVACSLFLRQAKLSYKQDQTKKYQYNLGFTLILSIVFLASQIFAYKQLLGMDIAINHSTTASFLYLVSAVHFLHVIAGIPFLLIFLITSIRKMRTPVSVLVYFSDPEKYRKLRLLTLYWHFIDILWIYLVIFFLINYLIK